MIADNYDNAWHSRWKVLHSPLIASASSGRLDTIRESLEYRRSSPTFTQLKPTFVHQCSVVALDRDVAGFEEQTACYRFWLMLILCVLFVVLSSWVDYSGLVCVDYLQALFEWLQANDKRYKKNRYDSEMVCSLRVQMSCNKKEKERRKKWYR